MASQPSREELLQAWKAKRAAAGAGGALQANNNAGTAGRGAATAAAAKPGLPPRIARAPLADKENGQQPAAAGGGAPARAGSAAPDSVRKAFASGQQKEEMLQEFDALQGRLAALKRDSVRPSISGLGAGGGAAAARPGLQHSTASTTLRPAAQEAAAARATQPASLPASSTASAAHPPLPKAPLQARQQQAAEPAAAAAPPSSQQQHSPPQQPQQQEQQAQPSQAMPPPPAVATTRGGTAPMDLDGPSLPPSLAASGVGGLAARLESLRRDSVRPSLAGGAAAMQGVQFEAAAPIDAQALSRLALQLFDDEAFRQLCDKGLNMQLTRSKDGATGEEGRALRVVLALGVQPCRCRKHVACITQACGMPNRRACLFTSPPTTRPSATAVPHCSRVPHSGAGGAGQAAAQGAAGVADQGQRVCGRRLQVREGGWAAGALAARAGEQVGV